MAGQWTPRICCLCLPSTAITDMFYHMWLFTWVLEVWLSHILSFSHVFDALCVAERAHNGWMARAWNAGHCHFSYMPKHTWEEPWGIWLLQGVTLALPLSVPEQDRAALESHMSWCLPNSVGPSSGWVSFVTLLPGAWIQQWDSNWIWACCNYSHKSWYLSVFISENAQLESWYSGA